MPGGFEYTRFNLFHVLQIFAAVGGAALGAGAGLRCFGTPGAIGGAIVGLIVSHVVALWFDGYLHRRWFQSLMRSSDAELRAMVAADDWNFGHTMALLNLAARDQDVRPELPGIIAMLESDSQLTRRYGWDAIRIVFTQESEAIADYDPRSSTEECRRKGGGIAGIPCKLSALAPTFKLVVRLAPMEPDWLRSP